MARVKRSKPVKTNPPRTPLRQALDAHLGWMSATNFSSDTVTHRRDSVGLFIAWAEERGLDDPMEITRPVLQSYQRHLYYYRSEKGRLLTVGTQRDRMMSLRAWFRWMVRNHHILYNPASDLDLPRKEKRLPRVVLSEEEAERVLVLPDIREPLGVRDRAILETFYSTGIRRTELCHLTIYDVDRERATLFISLGKGKKDRVIPIGERALAWVNKYLYEVRPQMAFEPDDGFLFLGGSGEPFQPDSLSQLVRHYVESANLGKMGACHIFRHTMATLMLEHGADIRYIQQMLGHADLASTQIYTQVSIRQLQKIHAATHPGAQLEKAQAKHPAHDEQDEQLKATLLESLEQECEEEDE
jgi:integrase/recombinase XerD